MNCTSSFPPQLPFCHYRVIKSFHQPSHDLPEIVILPERHLTEGGEYRRQGGWRKFFKHMEIRRTNQLLIDLFYKPGDVVYVERPRDRILNAAAIPQTCYLTANVVVKGWDDPASIKKLDNLSYIFTHCLHQLDREDYRTHQNDPGYQQALTHLHSQDVSKWTRQIEIAPNELPHPSMDEDTYYSALNKTNFAVKDHFYQTIPELYIEREKSLEDVLRQHKGGRAWVIGGQRHFFESKREHELSPQVRSVRDLHHFLESSGRPAVILAHTFSAKSQSAEEHYMESFSKMQRSKGHRRSLSIELLSKLQPN